MPAHQAVSVDHHIVFRTDRGVSALRMQQSITRAARLGGHGGSRVAAVAAAAAALDYWLRCGP